MLELNIANARLSERIVSKTIPADRDYFIWDTELKGFGLKVTMTGRKVYIVQYRTGGRKTPTRRYTIGQHDSPWTPSTARMEAKKILHHVQSGRDPIVELKDKERMHEEMRFDLYSKKFFEFYARREWADGTIKNQESNLRRWVVPFFRTKPIPEISRRDISQMLDQLPPDSQALKRTVFMLMRGIFKWALDRGDIEQSPIAGMRTPPSVSSRNRVLTDHEILYMAALADDLGFVWGAFFRLLILTGQRRSEIAQLSWTELDRKGRIWILPSERTKNRREHRIPLCDLFVAELDAIAKGADWPKVGFVLTHGQGRPVSGFSKTKRRFEQILDNASEEPLPEWRPHDIRRTVATNLQRLGTRFEVTEAILNHVSITRAGVAGVYQLHDWADEKRLALEAWEAHLLCLLDEWNASGLQ